ncbi:MAG: YicC family protein [Bacteroidetes bacterium]|nr:YicC family protein [Bacteroidota bacterium]
MTGFGKAVCELPQKKVTVEIRSLNSRQLDLNMRMPSQYREKEAEVRSELSRTAERGKIDFSVYSETSAEGGSSLINTTLFQAYYNEMTRVAALVGQPNHTDILQIVMRMPDVMKQERQEFDETEWTQVSATIKQAVEAFNNFRETEGKVLAAEFEQRIGLILAKLAEIHNLDPQRIAAVRERLQKALHENVSVDKIDQNRFEQELIYYLEKFDITEEKLRLQTHCEYFLQTMNEASSGRKLGFITQEIGREINTIGSKANDAGIQKIVVQMKDELEKIKEQLLNVL